MNIHYQTEKALPNEKLYALFLAVGWTKEESTSPEQIQNFNIGFLNSTFVFSAWDGDACPDSEFLVQTDAARGFYEKNGFTINTDDFLTIPCRWF